MHVENVERALSGIAQRLSNGGSRTKFLRAIINHLALDPTNRYDSDDQ
jgi:hypothetical protein